MENWYYTLNGQQQGPVPEAQLQQMIQAGQVAPNSLVWKQGMANWAEANTIQEFAVAPAAAAPGLASQTPVAGGAASVSPYASPNTQVQTGGPGSGIRPNQPMPQTYLWQAIAVTCCCCLPFGIVSIVKAASVSGKYNSGDYAGAFAASESAKKWAMWGVISGLIVGVLNVIINFMAASSSSGY